MHRNRVTTVMMTLLTTAVETAAALAMRLEYQHSMSCKY